jgi:hypothetical protein
VIKAGVIWPEAESSFRFRLFFRWKRLYGALRGEFLDEDIRKLHRVAVVLQAMGPLAAMSGNGAFLITILSLSITVTRSPFIVATDDDHPVAHRVGIRSDIHRRPG